MSGILPAANRVAIALLHYPVYDKNRRLVATAITNLDLHDIARAAKTFGLFRYYVVTPLFYQQELAQTICRHWQVGWGATYNPRRKAALDLIQVTETLDTALADLETAAGKRPRIVVTGALARPGAVSYEEMATLLKETDDTFILVFGTGWGLADEVFSQADYTLPPIRGNGAYNHLSVRSAAAIVLDRLFGR